MRKLLKSLFWIAAILGLLTLVLRAFFFDVWTVPKDPVPAASLAPTLAAGDRVLLLTYGEHGFGDLVRCRDPQDPRLFVVGRIAGLEGDEVEVAGASLTVENKRYNAESSCPTQHVLVPHPTTGSEVELSCDVVRMGGGWHMRAVSAKPFSSAATRVTVGRGMVFLVSDNRSMHDDSRDFGQVERASCRERLVARLWSKRGWSDDKARFTVVH